MQGLRAVELSHELFPGHEEYRLEVRNRHVDELLPFYKRPPDAWYVISEVEMWSHVGTHMESPFHYLHEGPDVAQIPLGQVVGECTLVDLSHKRVGDRITAADLQERGGGIREGDIVFIFTGLGDNYHTPQAHDRPYFTVDAIQWLIDKKISCLGVDCSGIEKRDEPTQPLHTLLFSHGIPLIEHLAHLEQLHTRRFFVVAVPLRIHGMDASPLSVVAFEQEGA